MSLWQLIFLQSRVNNDAYDEEWLPSQNWHWPEGTWFQRRRGYLHAKLRENLQEADSI